MYIMWYRNIYMKNKEIICPKCKSKEIKKDGKRKTENRGSSK